jgi:hypothetical protein
MNSYEAATLFFMIILLIMIKTIMEHDACGDEATYNNGCKEKKHHEFVIHQHEVVDVNKDT